MKNTNKSEIEFISLDITVIFIILIIEKMTGILFEEFTIKSRKRELVFARQLCMYFIKQNTKYSLGLISAYVGNRDHATVLHSLKTVSDLVDTDKEIRTLFNKIAEIINFKKPTISQRKEALKQLIYKTNTI